MKWMVVTAILTMTASVCQAKEANSWYRVGWADDGNVAAEIKPASIESINGKTVRALTRFVRKDSAINVFGDFGREVHSMERTLDFDCGRQRSKLLSQDTIMSSGKKVPVKIDVEVYRENTEGSLIDMLYGYACDAEGKPR